MPTLLPLLDDPLARAVIWAATLDAVRRRRAAGRRAGRRCCGRAAGGDRGGDRRGRAAGAPAAWSTATRRPRDPARPRCELRRRRPADRLLAAAPAGRLPAARRGPRADRRHRRRRPGCARLARPAREVPDGLAVDADLRWLSRPAGRARRGRRRGDRRRARAGPQRHRRAVGGPLPGRRCRRRRPRPPPGRIDHGDATLSNRLVEATADGFWQPEQLELTRPYVARYFAEMPAMAGGGPPGMAAPGRPAVAALPRYPAVAARAAPGRRPPGPGCVAPADELRRRWPGRRSECRRPTTCAARHAPPGSARPRRVPPPHGLSAPRRRGRPPGAGAPRHRAAGRRPGGSASWAARSTRSTTATWWRPARWPSRFALDEVVFVPTGQPWQKAEHGQPGRGPLPDDGHRDRVQPAVPGQPGRHRPRRARPTPSTPCATCARSTAATAELFFITGADALAKILSWKDAGRAVRAGALRRRHPARVRAVRRRTCRPTR